jgi:cAMP phosphodiesterase
MWTKIIFFTFILICCNLKCNATETSSTVPANVHFRMIPLGTSGGALEDNLSAYLISTVHSNAWIALDAGTLCSSLKKIPIAELKHLNVQRMPTKNLTEEFFTKNIKTYLISHAHLDHISGMVICSPIDSHKEIMGIDPTINYLRDYIFNWKIWPNFSDSGIKPRLGKYHYHRLPLGISTKILPTPLAVTAFILNHGNGYPSTAFLLKYKSNYLLYFGDTGADVIEKSQDMHKVWQVVAPLIKKHKLSAIFIEASYPNQQPNKLLFGHLNPHWLLKELNQLAILVDPQHPQSALVGLKVVVTHIKHGLSNKNMAGEILTQLKQKNTLGIQFILPHQNQLMYF